MLMFLLTALVSIYTKCGNFKDAFDNFNFMQEAGVGLAMLLLVSLEGGRRVPAQIHKSRFDSDVWLQNVLIVKWCLLAWMLNAGPVRDLFQVFHQHMQGEGTIPDNVTYVDISNGCVASELGNRPTSIKEISVIEFVVTDLICTIKAWCRIAGNLTAFTSKQLWNVERRSILTSEDPDLPVMFFW
ncbi:unnamed protein product [Sphagnum tenellum]